MNIPARLRAQYPREMTIVLQHQFWDLKIDEAAGSFDVSLSFSGVPSPLHIPFSAVVAFADPQVRYGVRFSDPEIEQPEAQAAAPPKALPAPDPAPSTESEPAAPQVVSLDAFRRRTPPSARDH